MAAGRQQDEVSVALSFQERILLRRGPGARSASNVTGRMPPQRHHLRGACRRATAVSTTRVIKGNSKITVGADCAGIMGATLALEKLGLEREIEHTFLSEKEAYVRDIITHNFAVQNAVLYTDVLARDDVTCPPCDVYTAGFPCQPFSTQGKREGASAPSGDGSIAYKLIKYVEAAQPSIVIFENVTGIKAKRHALFRRGILQRLRGIKKNGAGVYEVRVKTLNSKEHGVAQNRPRYYIVCLKRALVATTGIKFKWPRPLPTPELHKFLDRRVGKGVAGLPTSQGALNNVVDAIGEILANKGDLRRDVYVADIFGGRGPQVMRNLVPCLTKARCGAGGHYLVHKNRLMTSSEMMKLQGIPVNRLRRPPSVSERQFNMCVGNAFTVTVFARLLARALTCTGIRTARDPIEEESGA